MSLKNTSVFLPDLMSIAAFLLLVLRGHRSVARVITGRILSMGGCKPGPNSESEIESFVAAVFENADIQRRTNLAALVTLAGVFGLVGQGNFSLAAALLGSAWVLVYFVSTQAIGVVEPSKRQMTSARRKLFWLFFLWVAFSVAVKAMFLLGLFMDSGATK